MYRRNKNYMTLMKRGHLTGRDGDIKNVYTHDGRVYNDNVLEQVKNLAFMNSGKNVCVFGETNAGKSYMLVAVGQELCRNNIKCFYADYLALKDELIALKKKDLDKYYKKLWHYERIPVLIIDDFLAEDMTPDEIVVMFQLIKNRDEQRRPTFIGTQYDPAEWSELTLGKRKRKGEIDSIRRRLVNNAYLITITFA